MGTTDVGALNEASVVISTCRGSIAGRYSETDYARMTRSTCLAVFRVTLLVGLAIIILIFQGSLILMRSSFSSRLPVFWNDWCRRVVGMEVTVSGRPLVRGSALFVANHISYLDIAALGSVVNASFISRADVRNWPVFGFLAKLQKTIFLERKPRYIRQQMVELKDRLAAGDRLILFPEGTSSDGNTILPFKSSLFAATDISVECSPVQVQPISIAYTRLDGLPLGRLMRPIYAWYGDMEFVPHFWHLLGFGRFRVDLMVHDPVNPNLFSSRKELAQYCERVITDGFSRLLSGRPKCPPPIDGPSTA